MRFFSRAFDEDYEASCFTRLVATVFRQTFSSRIFVSLLFESFYLTLICGIVYKGEQQVAAENISKNCLAVDGLHVDSLQLHFRVKGKCPYPALSFVQKHDVSSN